MERRIALLGDSIPHWFGESRFSNVHLYDSDSFTYYTERGLSLRDCVVRRHPSYVRLLEEQPTDVFVHLGGNDFRAWVKVTDVLGLAARLESELYPARVLFGDILPRGKTKQFTKLTPPAFNKMAYDYNTGLRERWGSLVVPFYIHETRRPDGSRSAYFGPDEKGTSRQRSGKGAIRKSLKGLVILTHNVKEI